MIFTDEHLKTLADMGHSWVREDDGTLTYMAAYEHAMATIYPDQNKFIVTNEARDPAEKGIICERTIVGLESNETNILWDVARAVDNIDNGIEEAMTFLCPYDTIDEVSTDIQKTDDTPAEQLFDILENDIDSISDFMAKRDTINDVAVAYFAANYPDAEFASSSCTLSDDRKMIEVNFEVDELHYQLRFKSWGCGIRTIWLELVDSDKSSVKVMIHSKLPELARKLAGK